MKKTKQETLNTESVNDTDSGSVLKDPPEDATVAVSPSYMSETGEAFGYSYQQVSRVILHQYT